MLCQPAVADQTALYDQVSAAAVEVLVDGQLAGSGWFAPESGWAFTAAHVVPNEKAKIVLRCGGKEWKATRHARDVSHDVALLKVEGKTPVGLSFAKKFPSVGEEIFLYGAPIFRHAVWINGRVARKEPTHEYLSSLRVGIRCYYVTAMTPKGTSGGCWVNAKGEVVGLQSGMMVTGEGVQGLAFVTPCDGLASLWKAKKDASTASFLCASEEIAEHSPDWIKKWPRGQKGIVVKVLQKDSPLVKAGVKENDLIVSINGEVIETRNEFYGVVSRLDEKKKAKVVVRRMGEDERVIEVKPVVLERG